VFTRNTGSRGGHIALERFPSARVATCDVGLTAPPDGLASAYLAVNFASAIGGREHAWSRGASVTSSFGWGQGLRRAADEDLAPHLDPLPRYSLHGGGEKTNDGFASEPLLRTCLRNRIHPPADTCLA